MYKLKEAKLLKGRLAGTKMDWLCSEIVSEHGEDVIMCVDITRISNMKRVFVVPKGQPPGEFDFFPEAYKSFEQIWFAQNVVREWDKLKDGNVITASDEAEDKIREWGGMLYTPGGVVGIKQHGEVVILNREDINRELGRAEEAPALVLPDEVVYDTLWRGRHESY